MALPCYLAMTPEEFAGSAPLPEKFAWMSCRFSTDGPGLSRLPQQLPAESILVLEDSTSPSGHDPALIIREIQPFIPDADGVLLDFQKPDNPETADMTKALVQGLPCPVCVSEHYAKDLTCPIFLPPVPMHIPLEEYLSPYKGREIWLEAALCQEEIIVTKNGTEIRSIFPAGSLSGGFYDETLHCHYQTRLSEDAVTFTLFDTQTSLEQKLAYAQSLGVKRAVGLWQELGNF